MPRSAPRFANRSRYASRPSVAFAYPRCPPLAARARRPWRRRAGADPVRSPTAAEVPRSGRPSDPRRRDAPASAARRRRTASPGRVRSRPEPARRGTARPGPTSGAAGERRPLRWRRMSRTGVPRSGMGAARARTRTDPPMAGRLPAPSGPDMCAGSHRGARWRTGHAGMPAARGRNAPRAIGRARRVATPRGGGGARAVRRSARRRRRRGRGRIRRRRRRPARGRGGRAWRAGA